METGTARGRHVVVNTTLSASASAGATSISVTRASGISTGSVLRVGLLSIMEKAVVSGVSGTTVSLSSPLVNAHASGATLTDQGCLGTDADDNDATVWTNAQVITKYGTIPAFLSKLANDITIENPFCGSVTAGACDNGLAMATAQAKAAAAAAGLSSPTATYYLAPATPSAGCTGTTGQCTGSDSSASSTHCAINTPCLTVAGLISGGFTSGAGPGSLILMRDKASVHMTLYGGTSSKFIIVMSFPESRQYLTPA